MTISFEDQSRRVDPDDGWSPEGEEAYVVVIGDISRGHRVVGGFPTFEEAHAWSSENIGTKEQTWICNLFDPTTADALKP